MFVATILLVVPDIKPRKIDPGAKEEYFVCGLRGMAAGATYLVVGGGCKSRTFVWVH
jgi:hypothetical protein